MKLDLDVNGILTKVMGLVLIGVGTVVIGMIIEFPTIKSQVSRNTHTIGIAGKILCKYAIKDKLENADQICVEILQK